MKNSSPRPVVRPAQARRVAQLLRQLAALPGELLTRLEAPLFRSPAPTPATLLLTLLALAPAPLPAATLHWDSDGLGAAAGGYGTWNTTQTRWATVAGGSTYQAWNNVANGTDTAVFANGPYTVTLGSNITAGQLVIGSGVSFVLNGYNLTLGGDNSDSSLPSTYFNGAGKLIKTGTGSLALNSLNDHSGGIDILGGTLIASSASAFGGNSAPLTLAGGTLKFGASFDLANSRPVVLTGTGTFDTNGFTSTRGATISGAGSLVKTGAGTFILSAANSYSGGTTVSGGTLQIGNGGATGSILGDVTNNAALSFNRSSDLDYDGVISGAGSVTKNGAGLLTLFGNNTYTGATNVAVGTLVLGSTASLADSTAVTVSAGATLDLRSVSETIGSLAGAGNVQLSPAPFTVGAANTSTTFSGVISGSSGSLVKVGTGTLTLSGANTYSGGTTVSAGTLALGASERLVNTASLWLNGGTFSLGAFSQTVHGLYLRSGSITGTGTLTASFHDVESGSVSALLRGTGDLTKSTNGTVTLFGTNIYIGPTRIDAGTLKLGTDNALGGPVTLANVADATFALNNFNTTIEFLTGGGTTGGNVSLGSGTLGIGYPNGGLGSGSGTFGGIISGTGGITKSGAGHLILSGANTYSGITTINAGMIRTTAPNALPAATRVVLADVADTLLDLQASTTIASLAGGGASGGIVYLNNNASLTTGDHTDTTFAGDIYATGGSLIKEGTGTFTISGNNALPRITLKAGTLQLGSAGALGSIRFIMFDGGTLRFSANNTTDYSIRSVGADNQAFNIDTNGQAVTFASNLSSSGGTLAKSGSGTLTLSGANTYSGATAVNGGTLALGSAKALPVTTAVTLADVSGATLSLGDFNSTIASLAGGGTAGGHVSLGSGTLTTGSSTDTTFAGVISGSGYLVKQGSGTFTLSGANTYSGGTSVNGGILALDSADALGSSGMISFGGGTLRFSAANATDYSPRFNPTAGQHYRLDTNDQNVSLASALVSPAGSVTKSGEGTLTLSGANTYTGGTTLNGGVLVLGSAGALGSAGPISLDGGILRFSAANSTDYSPRFSTAAGQKYNLDTNGQDLTLASALVSPGGSLVKYGEGTLTLSAANTYSGATAIYEGTLALGAANALPATTAVSFFGALDLRGFSQTIGSLSGGVSVALGSGTLTTGDSTDTSFYGSISGSGSLIKQGSGTFTLYSISRENTYAGSTTINAGILALGSPNVLPGTTPVILANASGATLRLDRYDQTIGSLAGGGSSGGNVDLGSGTLTTGGNNTKTTFAGVLSGSGSLVKQGAGTFTLSGSNTYSGTTTINAGSLVLAGGNRLPATTALTLANVAGATLALANFNQVIASLSGGGTAGGSIVLGSATLTTGDSTSTTFSGVISGSGSLVKQGSGILTLSGSNTYSGTTTINAGTLALGGSDRLADSTAVILADVAGATLSLRGETIGSLAGGGATGGNVILGSGSLATGGNNASTTFAGVLSGPGSLRKQGSGTFTLSGANTYSGGTTLTAGILALGSAGALGDTGRISFNLGTLQFSAANTTDYSARFSTGASQRYRLDTNGQNVTLASALVSTNGSLTKSGSGTLTLSGNNTYTGTTLVSAGTLALGADNSLPVTTAVTLSNIAGATLDFGGFSQTFASLAGGGTTGGHVSLGSGNLTTGENTTTFAGILSGSGALSKRGSGTFTLTGANTYSGGTYIGDGSVCFNNLSGSAFGSGIVIVESGATLTGAGSFTGALQLNAGATFSPGNSPGLATIGGGSTLNGTTLFEIAGLARGTGYDAINVSGALTAGGTFSVSFYGGYTPASPATFDFFNFTSFGGSFAQVNLPTVAGYTWNTSQLSTDGTVSLVASAIPEPGTAAALLGAAALAFTALRRSRRR